MKVQLNLDSEVQSTSAKAPNFAMLKVAGKKTPVIAKSVASNFKDGIKMTSKAFSYMLKLRKLRADLETATEKRKNLPKNANINAIDSAASRVVKIKKDIAQYQRLIKMNNSDAALALKVFGRSISVPYSTAELCSPTKSSKLKTYGGLKIDGVKGFVKTAKSLPDAKLIEAVAGKKPAAKSPAKAPAKAPAKSPAKAQTLDEIEDELSVKGRAKDAANAAKARASAKSQVKIAKSVPEAHQKPIASIAKNITGRNSTLKASGDKIQYEAKGVKATISRDGEEYKLVHKNGDNKGKVVRGTLKALASKLAKAVKSVEATKGSRVTPGNYMTIFK